MDVDENAAATAATATSEDSLTQHEGLRMELDSREDLDHPLAVLRHQHIQLALPSQ